MDVPEAGVVLEDVVSIQVIAARISYLGLQDCLLVVKAGEGCGDGEGSELSCSLTA